MKSFQNNSQDVLTFTLGDGSEHIIVPGASKSLPADNDYIQSLVGQGILKEVTTPAGDAADKPKTK